jgi:hypothetical protein
MAQRLHEAERLELELDLQRKLQRQRLGLHFELADLSVHPDPAAPPLALRGHALRALLAFLVLLPLGGLVLGALDERVYDGEDLRRLQLPVLGHVPRFAGYQAGSLAGRRRRDGL